MGASGQLVIISGPSGVGKSTVVRRLLETCRELPLELSVSATTRPRRPGEVDGQDYRFLTPDEFQRRVEGGEFLEYVEVFGRGHWYGTLREPVASGLNQGKWIILEIDVEGAGKVLAQDLQAITIFIHPGSLDELERRLRARGTETEESLARRLEVAHRELESASKYQHIVVNDDVDRTAQEICQILKKHAERFSGDNPECTTS